MSCKIVRISKSTTADRKEIIIYWIKKYNPSLCADFTTLATSRNFNLRLWLFLQFRIIIEPPINRMYSIIDKNRVLK